MNGKISTTPSDGFKEASEMFHSIWHDSIPKHTSIRGYAMVLSQAEDLTDEQRGKYLDIIIKANDYLAKFWPIYSTFLQAYHESSADFKIFTIQEVLSLETRTDDIEITISEENILVRCSSYLAYAIDYLLTSYWTEGADSHITVTRIKPNKIQVELNAQRGLHYHSSVAEYVAKLIIEKHDTTLEIQEGREEDNFTVTCKFTLPIVEKIYLP